MLRAKKRIILKKAVNRGGFIYEDDVLIGVSTGFDFRAEHECGILELQNIAGITPLSRLKPKKKWFGLKTLEPNFGLNRTTIKNSDNILQGIAEMKDGSSYYVFGYNTSKNTFLFDKFEGDFDAYWNEESFIIASKDKESMTEIVRAAYDEDLAFTTGGKVLTDYAGIRLVIKSKCSETLIEKCEQDDIEIYELRKLDRKIDVQKKLRKAGCQFFACSPRWKDYEKREIHWWLNPQDQNNIESGFYTYDELIQWTNGKGPVFKKEDNTQKEDIQY